MNQNKPLLLPRLLLAAPLLLAGATVQAQYAWDATPRVALGTEYEDNPRLTRNEALQDSATGAIVDAELRLRARTERTEWLLRPRLRSSWYAGSKNEDLEDNDWYVDLNASHQLQRAGFGFTSNFQDVAVRSSEFASAIPDDPDAPPPTGDSGELIRVDDMRQTLTVNPYASLVLTERNRLDFFAGYTDVSFDRNTASRADYDYLSGGISFQHALDQLNRISIGVNASRFDAAESGFILENSSDNYGISGTWERTLSPTWTASATVGANRTSSETVYSPVPFTEFFVNACAREVAEGIFVLDDPCKLKDSTSNFVGSGELRRRGEVNNFTASVSRAISPNASGTEVIRDTFRVFFDRQFTEMLVASAGVLLYDEESVGEFARRDRLYYRGEASLRWRFAREWWLRGAYAYTRDKDDLLADGQSVDNHRVFVGIEWRGLGWRW